MKTLVLAPSFSPIEEIPVERAILLLLEGKAQSLKDHPSRVFRNSDGRVRVPAPLVVVLKWATDLTGVVFGRASWTCGNVYLRDKRTCQFCGRHEREFVRGKREVRLRYGSEVVRLRASGEFLTIDHVTPRCRGGKHTYENTVAACSTCNNRKADRTPAEARMYLRRKPKSVTRAQVFMARLSAEARASVEELFAEAV